MTWSILGKKQHNYQYALHIKQKWGHHFDRAEAINKNTD